MTILALLLVLIFIGAIGSVLFFRPKDGYSNLKVEKHVTGVIERIGQFNVGNRKQNSFILHLKDHAEPFYAHPNFGRSVYSPEDFVEMNKQLAVTQSGDSVELGVTTFRKTDGSSEQLVMSFKNTKF